MLNEGTRYENIVFDLDGTLLDTLDDLYLAVNFALSENGLKERSKEEVRAFVGNGIRNLMQRASGEIEGELFERVFLSFKEYYGAHCEDNTKPYDGVMEMLAALKEKGVKTAIVSNKADFATKKLAKTYFGELIEEAVGENESAGIRKKPAPDSLWAVMKNMGASKENTLYVGDSEVDIQTAKNAGVQCVSVTWGFKDRFFLVENGAKILLDNPTDILRLA